MMRLSSNMPSVPQQACKVNERQRRAVGVQVEEIVAYECEVQNRKQPDSCKQRPLPPDAQLEEAQLSVQKVSHPKERQTRHRRADAQWRVANKVTRNAEAKHAKCQNDFRGAFGLNESLDGIVHCGKDGVHPKEAKQEPQRCPYLADADAGERVDSLRRHSVQYQKEKVRHEDAVRLAQQELANAAVVLEEQSGKDKIKRHPRLLEDVVHGIVAVGKVSVASDVVQHDKQDANALRKVDVLDALLHKGKGLRFFFD